MIIDNICFGLTQPNPKIGKPGGLRIGFFQPESIGSSFGL